MKEKETEPTMIEKKNVRRRNSRVETDNELALRQLRDAWKQISIDGQWFKRQIWLFVVIVIGIIVYISNRYAAQQEIIEEQLLREELQDWMFFLLNSSICSSLMKIDTSSPSLTMYFSFCQ